MAKQRGSKPKTAVKTAAAAASDPESPRRSGRVRVPKVRMELESEVEMFKAKVAKDSRLRPASRSVLRPASRPGSRPVVPTPLAVVASPSSAAALAEGSTPAAIFDGYRRLAEARIQAADALVSELMAEVERLSGIEAEAAALRDRVAVLEAQVALLETKPDASVFQLPIKPKTLLVLRRDLELELEQIGVIFDMLEVITGLRIHNLADGALTMTFECSQMALEPQDEQPFTWDYRLVVQKGADGDIVYEPEVDGEQLAALAQGDLDPADRVRVERMRRVLPDYFQDSLSFPYNTLPQFFSNLGKALTKR